MECDASIMRYIDECLENPPAYFKDDWDVGTSPRASYEDAVVPAMDRPNEAFAYDEPAEEDPVFYNLDKSPMQQQEAYEPLEHVQKMAEQRVPTFGMPVAPSFHSVDHFEFVPADPQPSTSKAAVGGASGGGQMSENAAIKVKLSKPKNKRNRTHVARNRDVQQRNVGDQHDGKRLYAFTHRLLSDPNFEHVLRWLDPRNGVWQVVNSKEYARLWGVHKNNPNMTYKILGRALRYLKEWEILEEHGRGTSSSNSHPPTAARRPSRRLLLFDFD
ncbi:ETS domain-containing protein [Aphelenchoides fujianensis]|nr:ETS domain-containing protein [Aphelenchoides fujianensis]